MAALSCLVVSDGGSCLQAEEIAFLGPVRSGRGRPGLPLYCYSVHRKTQADCDLSPASPVIPWRPNHPSLCMHDLVRAQITLCWVALSISNQNALKLPPPQPLELGIYNPRFQ
jgi:hypothetical protein